MALPQKKNDFTFADYLTWDENERIELIEGKPVMQAAPSSGHQAISGELFYQIRSHLEGKKCRVFAAPFAVRLFEKREDFPEAVRTVVEPDLSVICDLSKIDKRGCAGAPDLIIEILSPSNAGYDMIVKLNQYLKAGVKEYWVVDPVGKNVQTFLLENGRYQVQEAYHQHDIARVNVLQGCLIELSKVFSFDGE